MLKVIGMILMLVDHIGMVFFEEEIAFRLIGRLAMPLFAYGIARGFHQTRSLKKYSLRLVGFAMLSQVPYWIMVFSVDSNTFKWQQFNIGFTFLGALLGLALYKRIQCTLDNSKMRNSLKRLKVIIDFMLMISILIAVTLLGCDYGAYGIVLVWVFYIFYVLRKDENMTLRMIILSTFILLFTGTNFQVIMQLVGGIGAFMMILYVRDKPFKRLKYLFYVFYPLHMLVLGVIKLVLLRIT